MTGAADSEKAARHVYCVMSARSLPYAHACLASLIRNIDEPLRLTVITDGTEDVAKITASLEESDPERTSGWSVHGKAETDVRAAEQWAGHPAVRAFHDGHPCWRKITDPLLFAAPGEEMIVIDPDVYFPNRFRFEPTPESGIWLMWQKPNCLLPEETVRAAFDAGIEMADHVDIGVGQHRGIDLDALEAAIEDLGGASLPKAFMHVEPIVWAALMVRLGGGYLDPVAWHCYANSVSSRMRRKAGRSGVETLRALDLSEAKCFHAGGTAKGWLVDGERAGLFSRPRDATRPRSMRPLKLYSRAKFERKFRIRRVAERLGLYRLLAR